MKTTRDHRRQDDMRWGLVLLILGSGVVSAFQVGKATAALLDIQADLGLGLAVASWLLSAFAIVGAIAGIAIGLAVDHVGARRMIVVGLLLQCAGSLLGAAAPGVSLLLAMRVLEGFGFLAVMVGAPALIVHVVAPRHRNRAMAVWATAMPVGLTGILLATPLLQVVGWRGFWLLNALVLLLLALLALALLPSAHAGRGSVGRISTDIRDIVTSPSAWQLASLFVAFSASFFVVFGFLPFILTERLMVSDGLGGILTGVAVATSAGGNLVCGLLLARGVGRRSILLAGFVLFALCAFGIFPEVLSGPAVYALAIVFAFTSGFIPVVLLDAAPRYAPRPEAVGALLGLLMQGNNVGLLIGPAATGAIAAAWGWPSVALLMLFLAAVAGVLALLLKEPGGKASAAALPAQCP